MKVINTIPINYIIKLYSCKNEKIIISIALHFKNS